MADFDPTTLPAIPDVTLHVPPISAGWQPPSTSFLPPLTSSLPAAWPGIGTGTPSAMTTAFGHYADPPAPNYFAPGPTFTPPPLRLDGLGPLGGAINPWLADPMGVAADEQRKLDVLPPIDPGLAAQQTIIHAPAISF